MNIPIKQLLRQWAVEQAIRQVPSAPVVEVIAYAKKLEEYARE